MTEADTYWMVSLGRRKYPPSYDSVAAELYFRNRVLKECLTFLPLRTDNAFCVSMIQVKPWTPSDNECHMVALCADDGAMWDALKLLRCSIEWAQHRKCVSWNIASDTGFDLTPLCKRLGATEISPRLILRF